MSIKVYIGQDRNSPLSAATQLPAMSSFIIIPNLHGGPTLIKPALERMRKSKAKFLISTECDNVINNCLPEELYPIGHSYTFADDKEMMASYKVGIQYISEILRCNGYRW